MAKYKKRADGRYYTTIATNEINPDTGKAIRIPVYGKTVKEFELNKAKVLDEINKGIYTNDKGITFETYKETWFRTYKSTKSYNTQHNYRNILNNHTAHLDDLPLGKIKKLDVQLGYNRLDGHADLQRRYLQTVRQIIKSAIDDRYIWYDITQNIETTKAKAKKKRALTPLERKAIPNTDFTIKEKCFVYLLQYAGLRRQEISALTRFDIDLKKKAIHINKAVEWNGEEPHLKATKTDAGERTIPILSPLFPVLSAYLSELDTTIMFPNTKGELLRKTQYKRLFDTIKRKINTTCGGTYKWVNGSAVLTLDMCQGLTSHVFRREFATILYYSGVDMLDAIRIFGHADVRTMMDIYAELRENESDSETKINKYLMEKYLTKI